MALGENVYLQSRYELILSTREGYGNINEWVADKRRGYQRRAQLMGKSYTAYLIDRVKGGGSADRLAAEHTRRRSRRKKRRGKVTGAIGEVGGEVLGGALKGALGEFTPDVDVGWYAKWGAAGVIGVVLVGGGALYYVTRK